MKYIITGLVLLMSSFSIRLSGIENNVNDIRNDITKQQSKEYVISMQVDKYYITHNDSIERVVLNYLKAEESLRVLPYKCSAGRVTIGYGHVILKNETWMLTGITEKQSDSILLSDFNKIKKRSDSYLRLDGYESYAMAAFGFNLGPNRIKQNELFLNCIINDLPIDDEIIRYTFFKDPDTKKYVQHNGLKTRRMWELNLYKQHKNLIDSLTYNYNKWQK